MGSANKVAMWHGMTRSHGFLVDVLEDKEQGIFIANIIASSPAHLPTLRLPGEKPAMMSFEDPEEIRDPELDVLKAKVKARLSRYGEILVFQER